MCHNSLYRVYSNYGMNTQNLTAHKKMLAIIIGLAIFATAGMGAASAQSATGTNTPPKITGSINIEQSLMSKVSVDFSAAATTAADGSSTAPISNGKVISGGLKPVQGSLVYSFKVIDGNNMVYSVIVDPSSGAVLNVSAGHTFNGFGMGHQGGMNGGFKHGGQGWNKQAPSTSTAPSGTTS